LKIAKRFLLALVGCAFVTAAAHADPAPAPAVPRLEPPVLVTGAPVPYPQEAQAEADVSVVVEVLVTVEGLVAEAKVIDGREPFAKAALDAVRAYTFTPAKRGDKAVAARIRIAVTFAPPPRPAPVVASEGTAPVDAQPVPKAGSEVEDVSVRGEREETVSPTETRLGRTEVRILPGAFGDPFRAIEILPGVVPIISGLPYYYVRGSAPSAVGYYIDEVRVPYLFHFGLGPGVIHPAIVEEVALHPAAFPGRYGRYSGGIIAGETRGPSPNLRGEGLIRLYDAGAFIEAPLSSKAYAGVGGRFSYTALLLSLLLPEATIAYRDYNTRFTYDFTDRLRFTAFAFGAFDYASSKERARDASGNRTGETVENVLFASEFHRLDLRLDHRGEGHTHSRVAATFGLDRTRIESARFARDFVLGLRGRHRQDLAKGVELEAGADVLFDFYRSDLPSPYAVSEDDYRSAATLFSPRTESASGAWLSLVVQPKKDFTVTATMRADLFTSAGKVAFGPSPRLSMRVPVLAGDVPLAALFALGVAPQPPAFAIPAPAIGYTGLPGGLAFTYQKSAGIEAKLPWKFTGKVVGFHHTFVNQRDIFNNRDDGDIDDVVRTEPRAQAFGLEVFLSRKFADRVSATVSYTLNRSELGSTATRAKLVSLFDRTHVFQAAGSVDLGRRWLFGARTVIYTGWPRRESTEALTGRLPGYYRFDARLEKKWSWGKTGYVSLIFEGLNVTGSKEVLSQTCRGNTCRNEEFGPLIVPSIGVEGAQ
jgi:TonB family protein